MEAKHSAIKKTKIIWSLEGSILLNTEQCLQQVEDGNFDALRIVYAQAYSEKIIELLKKLNQKEVETGKHVPLLLDVASNARARIKNLKAPLHFNYEDKVTIVCDNSESTKENINLDTNVFNNLFNPNSKIYSGSGDMVFEVESISEDKVKVKAIQNGIVYPDTDIHIPDTRIPPTVACLNQIDVASFAAFRIDYIVLPGISTTKEVSIVRKKIHSLAGYMPWIIVKVDSARIYENLPDVLPSYDGVLISRRELALSIKPSSVPMVSKEITQLACEHAKIVISASEILGSMRRNPTPTRAEVSDIANSVIDGVDAILLSQDLCHGPYMKRSLEVTHNVILDVEQNKELESNWMKEAPKIRNEFDAISFQAYHVAKRVNAKAIVCITKAGNTALKLSSFRQDKPIIAVTFSDEVNRLLSLVRGVEGLVIDNNLSLTETFPAVYDLLKRRSWLKSGDTILFVSVTISPMSEERSNLMTIQKVS